MMCSKAEASPAFARSMTRRMAAPLVSSAPLVTLNPFAIRAISPTSQVIFCLFRSLIIYYPRTPENVEKKYSADFNGQEPYARRWLQTSEKGSGSFIRGVFSKERSPLQDGLRLETDGNRPAGRAAGALP